jgi:hypothetical protein
MALLVDGRAVKTATVGRREPEDYRFDVDLAAGVYEIAAAFLNDALVGQSFACRGFLGKYRLAIQMPDGKVEREVPLTRDGAPEIVVRLAASSAR